MASAEPSPAPPALEARDVHVRYRLGRKRGEVRAVDGVSFALGSGEVLGLVGESGCGKSTLARALMGLVPLAEGGVALGGRDLGGLSGRELRRARLGLQMVFQDPYASLNPRMTVLAALIEPLLVHGLCPPAEAPGQAAELLRRVGLSPRHARRYPHEFSGGQRQRIAIARALVPRPRVLIADEPVSALDVSIQAQILNLLSELVRGMGLSLLFIAHDLSVVRHVSDRVAVMYLGRIVETGAARDVIEDPRHPYTRALVSAAPVPDPDVERARRRIVLPGDPPSPLAPPPGCPFHPRCPYAQPRCREALPPLDLHRGRLAACIRADEI